MIGTHTAVPHPAKGKVGYQIMHPTVVHHECAARGGLQHPTFHLFLACKKVESQGLRPIIDKMYCLLHILHWNHGQDGSEATMREFHVARRKAIFSIEIAVSGHDG